MINFGPSPMDSTRNTVRSKGDPISCPQGAYSLTWRTNKCSNLLQKWTFILHILWFSRNKDKCLFWPNGWNLELFGATVESNTNSYFGKFQIQSTQKLSLGCFSVLLKMLVIFCWACLSSISTWFMWGHWEEFVKPRSQRGPHKERGSKADDWGQLWLIEGPRMLCLLRALVIELDTLVHVSLSF